jgi:hypothetical protein
MERVLARETVKSDIVLELLRCGAGVPNFHNIIPKGFRITVAENPLPLPRPLPPPYTHSHEYCTSGAFGVTLKHDKRLYLGNFG